MTTDRTYRSPTNFLPCELSTRDIRDDYLALAVEAHNLHADRARTATLNLVFMSEEIDARLSTAVIEIAFN